MFTWRVLSAVLLFAVVLGGIKYLFDKAERDRRPKN